MSSKTHTPPAPYADIETVGIPRALSFYRYGAMWTAFFEALGRTVVVSGETDRALLERGESLSMDECCLASKIYLGHVDALRGRCDAVFVPSLADLGRFKGFCTKFQALPDLVRNTYGEACPRTISCVVEEQESGASFETALIDLALKFGVDRHTAKTAWKAARKARQRAEKDAQRSLEKTLEKIHEAGRSAHDGETEPLAILVVSHPYVAHDPLIGGPAVDALEAMGASVLFAHEFDGDKALKKSFEFSETMPWVVNRELVGALLHLHDSIDGIVIISAFPCGPDSMTNDAIARCIQGKPLLSLTVDAQSGTAGLETRIESFVDILRYRRKGGYLR